MKGWQYCVEISGDHIELYSIYVYVFSKKNYRYVTDIRVQLILDISQRSAHSTLRICIVDGGKWKHFGFLNTLTRLEVIKVLMSSVR